MRVAHAASPVPKISMPESEEDDLGFVQQLIEVVEYYRNNLIRLKIKVCYLIFSQAVCAAFWGAVRHVDREYANENPASVLNNRRNPIFLWLVATNVLPAFGISAIQYLKGIGINALPVCVVESFIDAILVFFSTLVHAGLLQRVSTPFMYAYLGVLGVLAHTALFVFLSYAIDSVEYVIFCNFNYLVYEIFASGNVNSFKNVAKDFKWVQWGSALRYQYDAVLRVWIGQYYARSMGFQKGIIPGSKATGTSLDIIVLNLSILVLFVAVALMRRYSVTSKQTASHQLEVRQATRDGHPSVETPLLLPLVAQDEALEDEPDVLESTLTSLAATRRDPRTFVCRFAFLCCQLVLMRYWGHQRRPTKDVFLYNPPRLTEQFRNAAYLWLFLTFIMPLFAMPSILSSRLANLDARGILLGEIVVNITTAVPLTILYNVWLRIHKLGLYVALAIASTLTGTAMTVSCVAVLGGRAPFDVVAGIPLCYAIFALFTSGVAVAPKACNPNFKWLAYLSSQRYVYDAVLRLWIGNYYTSDQGIPRGFGVRQASGLSFDIIGLAIFFFAGVAIVHAHAKVRLPML